MSEQLSSQINNRKVLAGVFTTFTFEPDFFELDLIPLLLGGGIPYSSDDRLKTFQVREALRESGLELEVFYDLPVFRQSAQTSPSMEYLCHGVKHNGGVFHAKNIYLLVQDGETRNLLLAAGSNNLSRSGWWENIEVQHWVEVNELQSPIFIQQLLTEVEYLLTRRSSLSKQSALEKIKTYLSGLKGNITELPMYYFGLSNGNRFYAFLNEVKAETLAKNNHWKLEIISPFFAENSENELHMHFLENLAVKEIVMLLPRDQEGTALCEQAYYDYINKSKSIEWGKWNSKIVKSLGVSGDLFRHVHAKIFHFYNIEQAQAWAFIGSVNFSYKAMNNNVESGFLVKLDNVERFLEPIPVDESVEHFQSTLELEPSDNGNEDQMALPELHISFDWVTKNLTGHTAPTIPTMKFEINVKNAEGKMVVSSWLLNDQESNYSNDTSALEELLGQGSLVLISGKDTETDESFLEHKILLQQTGWTHKPIDLPNLTLEQILSIYAGMSTERRLMLLINTQVKQLVLNSMGGEMSLDHDDMITTQFFCEYAEIFQAFRILKVRLLSASENNEWTQMDYYLTGAGMDSLPQLTTISCEQNQEGFNAVISYLLLLSAKELYADEKFCGRPNVAKELARVETEIGLLKSTDAIKLEENSFTKKEVFFEWFESQFFKQYDTKSAVKDVI